MGSIFGTDPLATTQFVGENAGYAKPVAQAELVVSGNARQIINAWNNAVVVGKSLNGLHAIGEGLNYIGTGGGVLFNDLANSNGIHYTIGLSMGLTKDQLERAYGPLWNAGGEQDLIARKIPSLLLDESNPYFKAIKNIPTFSNVLGLNQPDAGQTELAQGLISANPFALSLDTPSAPTGTTETYTIQPGDTLFEISRRTGVPMDVIARQNGIANLNEIQAGAVVNIDLGMRRDLPAHGLTPEERKALNAPTAEALARRALKLGGVTAPPKDALPAEIGRLMAQGYGLLEAADMAARYFSTPTQAVPEADLQVAAATVGVPDQAIKDVLSPEEVVQQQTIYHERPNSPEAAAALAKVAAAFAAAEAISPGYTSYKTDGRLQKAMNMDSNFRADMDAIARSIGITEKKGALET